MPASSTTQTKQSVLLRTENRNQQRLKTNTIPMKNLTEILAIKSFVDDPQNYADLQDFWRHTFTTFTGLPVASYVTNQYGNGKEILDGNPIFTSKTGNSGGIRIIQTERDDEQPLFSSWINATTINGNNFEELVFAVQLNLETFIEVLALINRYLNQDLTPASLQSANGKYNL